MARTYPMFLGGEWKNSPSTISVENPYDRSVTGLVAKASPADYTQAVELAQTAFEETREFPAYRREAVCRKLAELLEARSEDFARMMTLELGKAIKDSRVEVARAVALFRTAAEEAKRIGGEIIDLDWLPGSEDRIGLARRFPRGVIAGITPFNFPLNLVAHKIGPAIASGNCIVLKPASKTPIIALRLAELIEQTDYPKGAISILPGSAADAAPLLNDDRVKLVTFTGSAEIGWWIKANCGQKPVVLELGGNAGAVIADDADLDFATTRLLFGAFGVAGQSCISVQRIFVQESVHERFLGMFAAKVAGLKVGDPMDPTTDIGTLVDDQAVERTLAWIDQAIHSGAKLLCGGKRTNLQLSPTVLTNVTPEMAVCRNELFAPVAVVSSYRTFADAVRMVNDSAFGLQAGIFTDRISDIMYGFKRIETGGVIVNDVPTYRVDHMPYGGVKSSGLGKEGVRYAIEDMTELKLLALNPRGART